MTTDGRDLLDSHSLERDREPQVFYAGVSRSREIDHDSNRRMRHTFPTLLLQENAPITYVSTQLGHADPAITLRVYTHLAEQSEEW